jgi:four helix bundle protein
MSNKGYKKLKVYQEAHKLVLDVYLITKKFPKAEIFGLISQMRRTAISVVANILEGQARLSKKEFRHFLSVANGSLVELEYYFELALNLGYITKDEYEKLENQRILVGSLLGGFIRYLKS